MSSRHTGGDAGGGHVQPVADVLGGTMRFAPCDSNLIRFVACAVRTIDVWGIFSCAWRTLRTIAPCEIQRVISRRHVSRLHHGEKLHRVAALLARAVARAFAAAE